MLPRLLSRRNTGDPEAPLPAAAPAVLTPAAQAMLSRISVDLLIAAPDFDQNIAFERKRLQSLAEKILANESGENPQALADVEEISLHNSLRGNEITAPLGKGDAFSNRHVLSKRAKLLSIYSKDPSSAEAIAANRISGFHIAGSGGFLSVLRHGLLTERSARQHPEVVIASGERFTSPEGGRPTISFSDWEDQGTLTTYSAEYPDMPRKVSDLRKQIRGLRKEVDHWQSISPVHAYNARNRLNDAEQAYARVKANADPDETELILADFPVAYGISVENMQKFDGYNPLPENISDWPVGYLNDVLSSFDGEFMVTGDLPVEALKVVAAPGQYLKRITALIRDRSDLEVDVIPLEHLLAPYPVIAPVRAVRVTS